MPKVKAKIFYLPNYDKSWGAMSYAHSTDTGFDIRACNTRNVIIQSGERAVIPAGFKIMPQDGYALQIRARSGNALRLGLSMPNGVGTIDYGYLGEVGVLVVNLGSEPIVIERGMLNRCINLILKKFHPKPNLEVPTGVRAVLVPPAQNKNSNNIDRINFCL